MFAKAKKNKRGMIGGPIGMGIASGIGLGILTITMSVLAIVLSTLASTTTDTTADAVIANGSLGILNFSTLQPVFWIVLGLVIIIGLLLGVFAVYRQE